MIEIIVACIMSVASVAGVILSNMLSSRKIQADLKTAQSITQVRLAELTREVREHNGFARRMPVVEEQIKVINHRISDVEKIIEKGDE